LSIPIASSAATPVAVNAALSMPGT
jgi:hypothetical protein